MSAPIRITHNLAVGALLDTRGNVSAAARKLGVSRQALWVHIGESAELREALRRARTMPHATLCPSCAGSGVRAQRTAAAA